MEPRLSDDNFVSCAMHNYDKVACTIEEFEEDLYRIRTLNKCFAKYAQSNQINVNTILNNIIILFNSFNEFTINALLFKIRPEYLPYLRPFLVFINRDDDRLQGVILDENIVNQLRKV